MAAPTPEDRLNVLEHVLCAMVLDARTYTQEAVTKRLTAVRVDPNTSEGVRQAAEDFMGWTKLVAKG